MKTIFIPVHSKANIESLLTQSLKYIKNSKIALFTTIQHINKLAEAESFYKKNKIAVEIPSSKKSTQKQGIKAVSTGQILGCDATGAANSKADIFIYIGSGQFHPIALYLNSNKPILQLNPETGKVSEFDESEIKKFLAKKAARLQKLKDANKVGIWISTKPGQYNENLAQKIKTKLKKQNKQIQLFISDLITPTEMTNFRDIEVWINTACPRIIEDQSNYPRPILNAEEVE